MSETSSLRPEDIEVQTFAPLTPGFHVVDEDPTDPASGYDTTAYIISTGHTAHI